MTQLPFPTVLHSLLSRLNVIFLPIELPLQSHQVITDSGASCTTKINGLLHPLRLWVYNYCMCTSSGFF